MDNDTANQPSLAAFDAALEAHLASHRTTNEAIRQKVLKQLNRRKKLSLFMPLAGFLLALLIAGPQLWKALTWLSSALPTKAVTRDISVDSLASIALQVPIYAWLSVGLLLVFIEIGLRQR
ncbi:MAG: hypothetical protein AAF004_03065 [Pseudomonadota bacterium]